MIVFLTEKERVEAEGKIIDTIYGPYYPDGLSPPTADIVRRRFELSRRNEVYLPYQIRLTLEAIQSSPFSSDTSEWSGKSVTEAKEGKEKSKDSEREKEALETIVVEEVVDFEQWMVDPLNPYQGRKITLDGMEWNFPDAQLLLQHAALLVTAEDREEDSIAAFASDGNNSTETASTKAREAGSSQTDPMADMVDIALIRQSTLRTVDADLGEDNADDYVGETIPMDLEEAPAAEEAGPIEQDIPADQSQYGKTQNEIDDEDEEAWMKDL